MRFDGRVVAAAVVVALAGTALAQSDDDEDDEPSPKQLRAQIKRMETKRKVLWAAARYEETGFERLKPPAEGEWLARFPERGQTIDEYRRDCANKRRKGRETIYVLPWGPLSDRAKGAIEPARRFCEAFFGVEAKVLEERALPKRAYVKARDQYDEGPLMRLLERERTDDALVYAALADKDLFSGDLNFVFGVGSLEQRVGVYSLCRFTEGEGKTERVYRRRAFQLVGHELGHILSLQHCIFYKCIMNGSNSLEESDDQPCHLCPVCLEKLQWNVGFDVVKRYKELQKVFAAEGMTDEAKWVEAQATRLEAKAGAKPGEPPAPKPVEPPAPRPAEPPAPKPADPKPTEPLAKSSHG